MKVQTHDREGLFKALTVEVEGEEVRSALEEILSKLKETAEIQGFRKGNAPLWLIKAKYRDFIEEETGKKIANKTLQSAIKESSLTPVADIYLEKVELEDNVPRIKYTVSFEVPPQFELKDIEGIEVEVPKLEFNEEWINRRIEQLREEKATWEPVDDREVREGDLVNIEYEVVELKEEGEGEKVTGDTSGIIGQKMFREELEKELLGKKSGEEVFLENLPLYDQQGKEVGRANIRAKIAEVKEKVLPQVDDDFAKELGYENWEEARADIENKVREEFENTKKAILEDAVSDRLIKMHEFEIPRTLLNRELSFLIERRVKELQQLGFDTKYLDYRALAEEFMPQAIANIKLRYILDKYAQEKNLSVSDEDINLQYEELAGQMGTTPDEVKNYFEKENMTEVVKSDALRKKALAEIVQKAKIKEVENDSEGDKESAGSHSS